MASDLERRQYGQIDIEGLFKKLEEQDAKYAEELKTMAGQIKEIAGEVRELTGEVREIAGGMREHTKVLMKYIEQSIGLQREFADSKIDKENLTQCLIQIRREAKETLALASANEKTLIRLEGAKDMADKAYLESDRLKTKVYAICGLLGTLYAAGAGYVALFK